MPDRHITERTADGLIDEAAEAAFHGWDFSWLEGRSDDPKTPWRYRALSAEALSRSTGALDIDTGGGEALAALAPFNGSVVATEGYRPNIPIAGATIRAVGVALVGVESAPDNIDQATATPADTASHLPFRDDTFDLVLDRHSSYWAHEIARVLEPGTTYLTQQRGEGDAEVLRTFGRPVTTGPTSTSPSRSGNSRTPASRSSGRRSRTPPFGSSTSAPSSTTCVRSRGSCRTSTSMRTATRSTGSTTPSGPTGRSAWAAAAS
jgi:SAM-dependent methyltransferase